MTDLALALRRRGYRAVGEARERAGGADDFAVTLLGRRAVVLRSPTAVRAFYDESLVARDGAVPSLLKDLLFGHDAVHGLDGAAHRARKDLLRSVLEVDAWRPVVERVTADLTDRWRLGAPSRTTVRDELVSAYGGAALTWAGVDPTRHERKWVPQELARILDGFGGAVPAYPRAWVARWRTDRWFRARVDAVRGQRRDAPPGTALATLSDSDLHRRVAAVELANLVRPTVAVAWLGTAAALRLARSPQWRHRLGTDVVGRDHLAFAQEVRRTTPFVPALAGKARRDVELGGVRVRTGDRLVLDVWGVDQDPGRWQDSESFDPTRFIDWSPGPFDLVPQGGGAVTGHRCPGESLTLGLLCETVRVLALVDARLDVSRDAVIDDSRIPALPDGGLPRRC